MLSHFNKTEHLYKYSYFLTNQDCFFHRYFDTGFKTKWTGLWKGNKKLVEFFAFRIGDTYLSESNCIKTSYNYVEAVHLHELDGKLFRQSVFIPREGAKLIIEVQNEQEEAIEAELELAINTRFREENMHSRTYEVRKRPHSIEISSDIAKLFVMPISCSLEFEYAPAYKTHAPSNEQQCYFVPGRIILKGKRIALLLRADSKGIKSIAREKGLKKRTYGRFCRIIESDNKFLESAYRNAAINVAMLYAKKGFYAGLPWFLQFWSRDTFWSFNAFLFLGMHKEAKVCLTEFAKRQKNGRIPNYIAYNEIAYNSIDANPLFITALKNYVLFSADLAFLNKVLPKATLCIKALLGLRDSDGFIVHDLKENETWMDTLNRKQKAIEVEALFIKSLSDFAEIVSFVKKPSKKQRELAETCADLASELSKRFEKTFFEEKLNIFADRIVDNKKDLTKRPNALVPIMLRLSNKKDVLKLYESDEFLSEKGVRTLSKLDKSYAPYAYHNGQAWSLCTAWLACAEFASGRGRKGLAILKLLCKDFEQDAIGCIGECWDSESGTLLGCGLQLWGSSFIIRAIDEFMLGIRVNALKKELRASPKMLGMQKIVREIRIGRKLAKISFLKNKKGVQIKAPKWLKVVKDL